jgi:hypothetical protein
LTTFLNRHGITHILFHWDFVTRMHARDAAFDLEGLREYFQRTTRVEYSHRSLRLYSRP